MAMPCGEDALSSFPDSNVLCVRLFDVRHHFLGTFWSPHLKRLLSTSVRGENHPVIHRSGSTVWSSCRWVMKSLTVPKGILSCQRRVVQERPQSNMSFPIQLPPTCWGQTVGRGVGVAVPSNVTLKSAVDGTAGAEACAIARIVFSDRAGVLGLSVDMRDHR